MKQYNVGIVGATGMVGQRFITLLENHPWFKVTALAASAASAGKTYAESMEGRWKLEGEIPAYVRELPVLDGMDVASVAKRVDFIFCAITLDKQATRELEEAYAKADVPVISNNSAHRMTSDVPMLLPEHNAAHVELVEAQRARLGVKRGFIAVKPNCSIQSYVPALHPLRDFGIEAVNVCTYQSISGAGKSFADWPEMIDNVIPFIGGEEEKSEQEPLKIWGTIENGAIVSAKAPIFSAQCIRVPVTDGHLAAVSVKFTNKPTKDEIIARWNNYKSDIDGLNLPSAPTPMLTYFTQDDRPQTRLDRMAGNGMGITIGRLREDTLFDYKFVCLSHNTLRGAAGGGVLMAELFCAKGKV